MASADITFTVDPEKIDAIIKQINGWRDRALAAETKVRAIERIHCWTNEDGRRFMFVDDVAVALQLPGADTGVTE